MKRLLTLCICIWVHAFTVQAQLDSTGASNIDFSVDADTRTGFQKISKNHPDSTFHHDDWFILPGYPGRGMGVIDTTGAAEMAARLKVNPNISFVRRMSLPPYSVVPARYANGVMYGQRFWVDAVYFRDNAIGTDSTSFTGSKNGDNPNNWQGTISPVADKTDILDVYTHVRTSGTRPNIDSVWFFAGVSTVGTNGSRYFDIEVYKEPISYDPATLRFKTAGVSEGHSEWKFDAAGNVVQTGDIIISVSYSAGRAPEIDFRIWVSNTTFSTVKPKPFKFGTKFNSIGSAGYAEILANSGTTNWGTGVSNYTSNNAKSDSTYSTPWGTINATTKGWGQNYDQLQFVEVGLNFSRIGMNPFTYVTDYCKSPYSSILIKSRSSTEFNSALSDFVGPQQFTVKNLAPFTLSPDTLTCAKTSGAIQINAAARNYYRWYNTDGDMLQGDSDATAFAITKPGTYIVEATNFQACTPLKRDTVVIPTDYYKPVASIDAFPPNPYHQLVGGNEKASNYLTPFGGSQGLLWNWTGPNGYTSTIKDPQVDTLVGKEYQLVVTEKRNGCKDTAYFNLAVLYAASMQLYGTTGQHETRLWWNRPDASGPWQYEVQRSMDGTRFVTIGNIGATTTRSLSFTDAASVSTSHYRIRASKAGAAPVFSSILRVGHGAIPVQVRRTADMSGIQVQVANSQLPVEIQIVDFSGRLITRKMVAGVNIQQIDLPPVYTMQPVVVAIYKNGQLIAAEKK